MLSERCFPNVPLPYEGAADRTDAVSKSSALYLGVDNAPVMMGNWLLGRLKLT